MKKIIPLLAIVLLLVPSVQALQLEENLFFTIPGEGAEPTVRCVDVVFPDDSGQYVEGLDTYTLSTDSEWASLSYRIITTDVNNTVIIPICYTQRGDELCSDPYVISILTDTYNISRDYIGGVCLSGIPDVDMVSDEVAQGVLAANGSIMDVLNENVDIMGIGFETDKVYARPGESVSFNLLVESHALLNIDLAAEGTLGVSPQTGFTTTSSVNNLREIPYTVIAPLSQGEYTFQVVATIRDCDQSFCTRSATGTLVVTSDPPEGYSVRLFPESLNIKELRPVLYRYTISNQGPARSFDIDIELSDGLTSTFRAQTLDIPDNGAETISFSVVPSLSSSQFQITVTAQSEGDSKPATAYLSTNEMLTDVQRYADQVAQQADEGTATAIQQVVDDYANSYNGTEYGEGLDDYSQVRNAIDNAQGGSGSGSSPPGAGFDMTWIIIIIIIVVIVIVAFVFLRKKKENVVSDDVAELE